MIQPSMNRSILNNSHELFPLKQELLDILADNLHLSPLKKALEKGQECIHWLTSNQITGIERIVIQEGYGAYPLDGSLVGRGYQTYLTEVIQPRIRKGEISDGREPGSYDDRKLRWSNTNVTHMVDRASKTLRLAVGPTWYQHCQMDIQRDPAEALKLMLRGLKNYDDPYAYFARGLGVVVIPLTRDGHVFIGKRGPTNEYKNFLCFVSGWASFCSTVSQIDLFRDLEQELQEEIHLGDPIRKEQTDIVGLAGHLFTGEADLVFITQTDLNDDYFDQGNWPEHETWYAIRNRHEARQLLECGTIENTKQTFEVMFSSRIALEFLINNHWS